MHIHSLRKVSHYDLTVFPDANRSLFWVELPNVRLEGRSIHYPNCLLQTSEGTLINPYDERVMSLQKDSFYDGNEWEIPTRDPPSQTESEDVFFFVYNVDNYYHFIYDTLPILYSYFEYRKLNPSCKLLIQTSHPSKKAFAPFVLEFLESLGISEYILADANTLYKKIIVSTSFTHGGQSNDPPAKASFTVWRRCLSKESYPTLPKRFYISRRSWVHGKTDNLGTNYTQRRKCENETELVALLESYGIQELFTELLTTDEKLALFANAELVVGVVGGGMCNLLFSPPSTKSLCIQTPYFLDINARFRHSMDHTRILYSDCSIHAPAEQKFLLFSRVRITNPESPLHGRIGEVEGVSGSTYALRLSSNDVAGFSQDFPMDTVYVDESELDAVDKGLNSPFLCDLSKLEADLKTLLDLD